MWRLFDPRTQRNLKCAKIDYESRFMKMLSPKFWREHIIHLFFSLQRFLQAWSGNVSFVHSPLVAKEEYYNTTKSFLGIIIGVQASSVFTKTVWKLFQPKQNLKIIWTQKKLIKLWTNDHVICVHSLSLVTLTNTSLIWRLIWQTDATSDTREGHYSSFEDGEYFKEN